MHRGMYELDDTIVAVSSPTQDRRVIVRLSGAGAIEIINRIFVPKLRAERRGIVRGRICLDDELEIEAHLYQFARGQSYTGESLAEIHFWSNPALSQAVVEKLLEGGARPAEPGEFTARAYLNGRMDLAAAEAVNKVVTCSNRLQLAAAEKLLAGRLTETTAAASKEIINILSLLEAGMDFSEEDIDFISAEDAIKRIDNTRGKLQQLLDGSISFEVVLDLPAVGIAGAVNAGKSSLLNCLLGRQRSIVSAQARTTRDVLAGIVETQHSRYVLFDCAGLVVEAQNEIDILAQQAAIEALDKADVVIFCVDATKQNIGDDLAIRQLFRAGSVVPVATKCDLLDAATIKEKQKMLRDVFGAEFLPISSLSGEGLDALRENIEEKIRGEDTADRQASVALTARHKQSVGQACENLEEAAKELQLGKNEVAAMLLRAAYSALANLEREHIDEKILDNIFSQFCIGK